MSLRSLWIGVGVLFVVALFAFALAWQQGGLLRTRLLFPPEVPEVSAEVVPDVIEDFTLDCEQISADVCNEELPEKNAACRSEIKVQCQSGELVPSDNESDS